MLEEGSMEWLNLFLLNVALGIWVSGMIIVYPLLMCVEDESELD